MIQARVDTYELIPLPIPPCGFTAKEEPKPEVTIKIKRVPIYVVTTLEEKKDARHSHS